MSSESDTMLKQDLDRAIEQTDPDKQPPCPQACPAHPVMLRGVNILLRCEAVRQSDTGGILGSLDYKHWIAIAAAVAGIAGAAYQGFHAGLQPVTAAPQQTQTSTDTPLSK